MTSLDDTIRVMLETPDEQTYRLRLLDRLEEESPDARAAYLDAFFRARPRLNRTSRLQGDRPAPPRVVARTEEGHLPVAPAPERVVA